MAPRPVCEAEASKYALDGWRRWPVPALPPLTPDEEPWHGWQEFWNTPCNGWATDFERTAALAAVDCDIRERAGNQPEPPSSTSYGLPYQLVDSGPSTPTTKVWNTKKYRVERLPLPPVVRRQGDPSNYGDQKWIGYDPVAGVLYEASSLNIRPWYWFFTGCSWVCDGLQRWDTFRPWDAPGQPPAGCVAAKWPLFPMVVRWEEIAAGRVTHAVHGTLPNYAPEKIAPARGTDGMWPGHPVRSGERLRLKRSAVERFTPGTAARIIAEGLWEFGWCHGDKTTKGDPTKSHGSFQVAQDRRFVTGEGAVGPMGIMQLRLVDFEVVVAPADA